jgi:hypothetical protein
MGEIKQHEQKDCPAISEFIETYYRTPEGNINKRSNGPEYYEWRLGPNPFGKSLVYTYWEGGKVLGLSTATPVPFAIRGEKIIGYQYHDGFMAPHLRGKGIFGTLTDPIFKDFTETKCDLMYGMGPSPSLKPVLCGKYGMTVTLTYRQVFSPLRLDTLLEAKGFKHCQVVGKLANGVRSTFFSPSRVKVEKIEDIDASLFAEPSPEIDFAIDRNRQWFQFRYIDCPEPYVFFMAFTAASVMALVVKFVDWRGLRLCYLMDVIGNAGQNGNQALILSALAKIGIETGSALVSVELHKVKRELLKIANVGYVAQKRAECVIVMQQKWTFLNPSSRDYDSRRWDFISLDADYM